VSPSEGSQGKQEKNGEALVEAFYCHDNPSRYWVAHQEMAPLLRPGSEVFVAPGVSQERLLPENFQFPIRET